MSRFASPTGSVIDVGAGESVLADALLRRGWTDVTVLDVSREAVAAMKSRLAGATGASFIVANLLDWRPPRQYDVWHDRAVLHFLVEAWHQAQYSAVSAAALRPGGVAILGTFAADGPTSCSGLPTCRYDAPMLSARCGGQLFPRTPRARGTRHTTERRPAIHLGRAAAAVAIAPRQRRREPWRFRSGTSVRWTPPPCRWLERCV